MIPAFNLLTILFNGSTAEIVINAPEGIVLESKREMGLTLDVTLSRPSAGMVVIKQEFQTCIYENTTFFIRLNV